MIQQSAMEADSKTTGNNAYTEEKKPRPMHNTLPQSQGPVRLITFAPSTYSKRS